MLETMEDIFSPDGVCYNINWKSEVLKSLQDCFDLTEGHRWFAGPEEYEQHFPISHDSERRSVPYVPGDMLQVSNSLLILQLQLLLEVFLSFILDQGTICQLVHADF